MMSVKLQFKTILTQYKIQTIIVTLVNFCETVNNTSL